MDRNPRNESSSYMDFLNLTSKMSGCVDKIVTALARLCARMKSSNPQRADHTKRVRMKSFKESLARYEKDWTEAMRSLFLLVHSNDIYTSQAQDIIGRLKSYSLKQIQLKNKHFNDECYKLVIDLLTKPIVRMIMEEREVSKGVKAIQERRSYFILQLLIASVEEPPVAPQNESDTSNGSVIIVVDLLGQSQERGSQNNSRCNNPGQNTLARDCTREGRLIVEALTRALNIHSMAVSNDSHDEISRRKFHIVNIAYITDSLRNYLLDLRERLTLERQVGNRINTPKALPECKKMLEHLSSNLATDLDLIDYDTTMVIFRHDLKMLSFQTQLLIQMTKSN